MENHPEKLFLEGFFQIPGIFLNPVYADIDFPSYRLISWRKLESDDIGEEIMLQVLFVYGKQALVCAENIIQAFQLSPFLFKDQCNELL